MPLPLDINSVQFVSIFNVLVSSQFPGSFFSLFKYWSLYISDRHWYFASNSKQQGSLRVTLVKPDRYLLKDEVLP